MSRSTRQRIEHLLDLLSVPPEIARKVRWSDELPPRIGRFPVIRKLGEGGFASVYLAYDDHLQRPVAIKKPHQRGENMLAEARRLASLRHPHIVTIHDVVAEPDGSFFLISEFLEGGSLADRIRSGWSLPPPRAVALMIDVVDAVAYAHRRGVVHRDLKPDNVLLDGFERPHVVDFGLAIGLADRQAADGESAWGTLQYTAPERLSAIGSAGDCRSDVWSLGVMLYELLVGRPPFSATEHAELRRQLLCDTPEPLLLQPLAALPGISAVVQRCLQKTPAQRYTAEQLGSALRECLGRTSDRSAATPGKRPSVSRRTAATALVLALPASIVWLASRPSRRRTGNALPSHAAETMMRRYDYAQIVRAVHSAWQNADVAAARADLRRCIPPQGQNDLRSFEWHYLHRLCAGSQKTYSLPARRIYSVAFDPTGARLAVCSEDGAVSLINTTAETVEQRFIASTEEVYAIAWSPDGKLLAAAGVDGQIRLWDAATVDAQGVLTGHRGEVVDLAFSPDGRRLATIAADGEGMLWDVARKTLLGRITGQRGPIHGLAFSRDGANIYAVSEDGTLCVTPVEPVADSTTLWKADGRLFALALSPTDDVAAVAAETIIYLLDLKTGTRRPFPLQHRNTVRALAFSPDGSTLASASDDQTITVWDVETQSLRRLYRGHTDRIYDLEFSANGHWLASTGKDASVKLWDPAVPADRSVLLEQPGATVGGIGFSAEGEQIAAVVTRGEDPPQMHVWPFRSDARQQEFEIVRQRNPRLGVVLFGNRRPLPQRKESHPPVTQPPSEAMHLLSNHLGRGSDAALSPQGDFLAVAEDDQAILYDLRGEKAPLSLPGQRCVAFSPDGREVAMESNHVQFAVEVWEVASRTITRTLAGHTAEIRRLVFSPNGQFLLSASADSTARLWDHRRRRVERTLRDHSLGITDAAFHPDGTRVVTGGEDGRAIVWDVMTGEPVLNLSVRSEGQVRSVAFSPDGQVLATGSVDRSHGFLELWHGAPRVGQGG